MSTQKLNEKNSQHISVIKRRLIVHHGIQDGAMSNILGALWCVVVVFNGGLNKSVVSGMVWTS